MRYFWGEHNPHEDKNEDFYMSQEGLPIEIALEI
jgi:hypothetical protein